MVHEEQGQRATTLVDYCAIDVEGLCPPRQALDLIADRWTLIVVKALADGIQRYGALHRYIGGISQKMLTQTLRALERDGLVRRTVYPIVPPKVEYALTPLGETLIEPLMAIGDWAERYMGEILEARRRSAAGEGPEAPNPRPPSAPASAVRRAEVPRQAGRAFP